MMQSSLSHHFWRLNRPRSLSPSFLMREMLQFHHICSSPPDLLWELHVSFVLRSWW